ncbi:MAG: C4-type zinc ribbon domain-containing protein [Kofleriaceae bacterium]
MREQLVLLLQLQQSDVKVRELQSAVIQLPARLDPLRRDLAKLQGMLDGERTKLGETNTWRKGQQDHIDRERDSLKQAQNKFQASKNTKEFNASSREVENKRKAIGDRETELKKVNEAAVQSNTQLEARDKDVESLRTELSNSEAAMADQLNGLKAELAEATAVRDLARGQVETQWVKIYDSLVGKRGYAVAPVIKGVCQGCHMALPPQLNNILARMQSIEMCPRCGRLVYRKELLEDKPEGEAAAPVVEEAPVAAKPAKAKRGAAKAAAAAAAAAAAEGDAADPETKSTP